MKQKKTNKKPIIIFALLMCGMLIYGFSVGFTEYFTFGDRIDNNPSSIENIDYQTPTEDSKSQK